MSLGAGTLAQAEQVPFFWEFINVELDVQDNGDMLVAETQKYVFVAPHTTERYRVIPLDKVRDITDVQVFEGDRKLPSRVETKGNQLTIRWSHQLSPPDTHTFVIKYRVTGAFTSAPTRTGSTGRRSSRTAAPTSGPGP